MKKRALGRGLSALLPDSPSALAGSSDESGVLEIPLDDVRENPLQPRRVFDEARLAELAESVRVHGVVQPVVVTRAAEGFRLVVGERRCRAARLAGLERIPALVRELADQQVLEIALIENLQREDLNPIEEAQAFSYLLREHGLTHEQLAERLGCSRPAISNALRLLSLPEEIRADLQAGVLSPGHARTVLALEGEPARLAAWRQMRERELSVRQAEELVSRLLKGTPKSGKEPRRLGGLDPDWQEVVDQLQRDLGAEVRILSKPNGRGRLELHYRDQEELERLVEVLVYLGEREASRPSSVD